MLHRSNHTGKGLPPKRCDSPKPEARLSKLLCYSDDGQRFRDQGCPNCEGFLHLAGSPDAIDSCTSNVFEGVITLSDPERSWVAKWQRLDKCHPGMYAIKVDGELPNDVKTMLEEENIPYVP